MDVLALTDHDSLQGLPEARDEARRAGIELISGAEISAEYLGQDDIHILALFVDENNASFNARLAERQENRRTRGELLAKKIVEAGYPLDLDAIRAEVGGGVWARPHLARALVRAGHATSHDDAFQRFLGREHPWHVSSEKWPALDVVAAIRAAGGVSSIAHAVWYKDSDRLIRELARHGLDAVEVFHPDHDPAEEARLGSLAAELGLAVTAGSDYHGTPEGRKKPGGVVGDGAMLDRLKARIGRPAAAAAALPTPPSGPSGPSTPSTPSTPSAAS